MSLKRKFSHERESDENAEAGGNQVSSDAVSLSPAAGFLPVFAPAESETFSHPPEPTNYIAVSNLLLYLPRGLI